MDPVTLRAGVLLLVGACLCGQGASLAADWQASRKVTLGVLHSDNVGLVPEPDRQGATVAQVVPSFSAFREGRRSRLLLLSELEYLRGDEAGAQTLKPRLFGSLESRQTDESLFLGASVDVRRVAENSGNVTLDALRLNDDLRYNYTFNFYPHSRIELGRFADARLGYDFTAFTSSATELQNSVSNALTLDLDHTGAGKRYRLGTSFGYEHTALDGQEPLIQRSAELDGGLSVSQTLELNGTIGREWGRIPGLSADATDEAITVSGTTWDVGLTWRPLRRTTLTAGYGKRFFGEKPSLEIAHRLRRARFSLGWSRGLTRSRASLPTLEVADLSSGLDDVADSAAVSSLASGPQADVLVNEVAIQEDLRADVRLRGRRTELRFEGLYARQDLRFQQSRELQYTATLRTSLTRSLGRRTSVTVSYQHVRGNSELRYDENQIGAAVTIALR